MDIGLVALVLALIGVMLIGLGIFLTLYQRSRYGAPEGEGKAYGVVLIGPLPIIIRGKGSAAWFMLIVFLAIILVMVVAVLISIFGVLR
ncbi:hypothetical protein ATG_04640 [Desulfurococcaceae archaeon AG1]|jgi:uncharacterized protein (TIGR00304 family)|nr:MAG: hypothetical protein DJ555_07330 [Desulfurococcaceae archaeon]GAY25261.1 hypothetical protein ATG_04640 [Desulfurococcaceae archaeon AG1]